VRRFLSGYSGVLHLAAATDFDTVEAAPFLHELKIGNQPVLAREREGEGGGGCTRAMRNSGQSSTWRQYYTP